jgi:hypothetical protein
MILTGACITTVCIAVLTIMNITLLILLLNSFMHNIDSDRGLGQQ